MNEQKLVEPVVIVDNSGPYVDLKSRGASADDLLPTEKKSMALIVGCKDSPVARAQSFEEELDRLKKITRELKIDSASGNIVLAPCSTSLPATLLGQASIVKLEDNSITMYGSVEDLLDEAEFSVSNRGFPCYKGNPFMNTRIVINGIIRSIDENGDSYYLCSAILNNQVTSYKIPVGKFTKGEWLYKIPGFAVFGTKRAMDNIIFQYLNILVSAVGNYSEEYLSRKPGFHKIQGENVYLTPDGVIGSSNFFAKAEFGQSFGNLPQTVGDIRSFVGMAALTPNLWIAGTLLLYIVLGFIKSLFKEAKFPVKFVAFLAGASGTHKTSLALAMTQIQRTDSPEFILKSTKAGLEAGYRKFKDAIMLIDDLAPTDDASQRRLMENNLETILRAFGDGTGGKRNYDFQSSDFKVEQYEAESGAIITGEYISSMGSSLARMLILPLNAGDVDTTLLTNIQRCPRLAPFMYGFLRYVTRRYDEIVNFIEQWVAHRAQVRPKFAHSRTGEYEAQLLAAAELLVKYGLDMHQLTKGEAESLRGYFCRCIQAAIEYNNQKAVAASPLTLLSTAIVDAIGRESLQIFSLRTCVGKDAHVILQDESAYYLRPADVLKIYDQYRKENGIIGTSRSAEYLGEQLTNANILEPIQEGKIIRKARKIPGAGSTRYWKLDKQKLYAAANAGGNG